MVDEPASRRIDSIIQSQHGWKRKILTQVRVVVHAADPDVVEEVKWKTASRPEGLPVWEHNGILCIAEVWEDNIKLIFFKGAQMRDNSKLFNARLQSRTDRAVEYRDGDAVDKDGLKALVREAIELNQLKRAKR